MGREWGASHIQRLVYHYASLFASAIFSSEIKLSVANTEESYNSWYQFFLGSIPSIQLQTINCQKFSHSHVSTGLMLSHVNSVCTCQKEYTYNCILCRDSFLSLKSLTHMASYDIAMQTPQFVWISNMCGCIFPVNRTITGKQKPMLCISTSAEPHLTPYPLLPSPWQLLC